MNINDVINNTDGISTYKVTLANGIVQNMTRDCLLNCHLRNANKRCRDVVKKWELNPDTVAPKPHTYDFGSKRAV